MNLPEVPGPDVQPTEHEVDGVQAENTPDGASEAITSTGNVSVDDALAALSDLDSLPVEEHPQVFEDIHRRLRGALSGERGA